MMMSTIYQANTPCSGLGYRLRAMKRPIPHDSGTRLFSYGMISTMVGLLF